jgi:hypothetical protein
MKRFVLAVVAAGFVFLGASILWAEDSVYFVDPSTKKETSLRGVIEKEGPTGITIKSKAGAKEIPALTITQVVYESKTVDAVAFRAPDKDLTNAQRETKPEKKAALLKSALAGFQELDTKLRDVPAIHAYLQYRIAQTTALQAHDDPSRLDAAIAALVEFKTGSPLGWEIVPALQLLAQLQETKGDTSGASQTYSELADVPGLDPSMKLKSQLYGARLLLRVRKFAEAEAKLKKVRASMEANDPQRLFVDVYQARAQMARGDLNGIEPKLKAAITASKDASLLALAYNTLGDYYLAKKQPEEAFWQYLRVDVMYPDDKEEEAKALYHLAQLFDRPRNDLEKADAWLAKLKSAQFDGTLYQRLAANEKKSRE